MNATALAPARPKSRLDGVSILTVYLFLLVALPSDLVVHGLGAAGTPANIFGMFCFVWWFTSRAMPSLGAPPGPQPVRIGVALLALAVLASYVAAMSRDIARLEINSADRGLLSLLGWAGVALLAADSIADRQRLEVFVSRMVLAASFLAAIGIIQYTTSWNPVDLIHIPGLEANHPFGILSERSGLKRVTATTSHPIEFGVVMATLLPFTLHFAFHRKNRPFLIRWLPAGLVVLALPMPVARSAVLGAAVVLIMLIPTWPWRRRLATLIVLPIVLFLMRSALPGLLGTLKALFIYSGTDPSIINRQADYAPSWQYIQESPWFGRGFQTFIPSVYRTLDNAYLGISIEAGLLGLAALVGVQLIAIMSARGARRRLADESGRDLAQCLAAAAAVPAFNLLTFDGLGFAMCAGLLFLDVGLCGALWRLSQPPQPIVDKPPSAAAPPPFRRSVQGIAAVIALLFVAIVTRDVRASPGRFYAVGATEVVVRAKAGANQLLDPADVPVLTETVVARLSTPQMRTLLLAQGATSDFRVAIGDGSLERGTDITGTGPILQVAAVAATSEQALLTRKLLIEQAGEILSQTQDEVGTPAARKVDLSLLSAPSEPRYILGNPSRATAGMLLLAILLFPGLLRLAGNFADRSAPQWARATATTATNLQRLRAATASMWSRGLAHTVGRGRARREAARVVYSNVDARARHRRELRRAGLVLGSRSRITHRSRILRRPPDFGSKP